MTSEIYEKIKEIKEQISHIEKEERSINPNNYIETDIKIKKIRNILSSMEQNIGEVSIMYDGLQKQEQLEVINEIKPIENEYKIKKNNIDKIDEKNTQKLNWEKLRNNEISGYDAQKIERKEYENQYHEVENHEEIINTIHKDVKEVYEQFETSEVDKSINLRKNKSNKFFLLQNKLIIYILLIFALLCISILLLFLIKSHSTYLELNKKKSIPTLPPKCDIGYKPLKDKCVIDYSIK